MQEETVIKQKKLKPRKQFEYEVVIGERIVISQIEIGFVKL